MKAFTLPLLTLGILVAFSGCAQKIVSQNKYREVACYIESENKRYTLPEGQVNYQALTDAAIETILDDDAGFFSEAKELPKTAPATATPTAIPTVRAVANTPPATPSKFLGAAPRIALELGEP